MSSFSISVVSYLNSRVFVKGLQQFAFSNQPEIHLDIPAVCADKLRSGQVDIGLVPLAVLPSIPNAHIISDFCISATKEVNSVFIFSNVPIENLTRLYLDPHSNTSNRLAQILLKEYWHHSIEIVNRTADLLPLEEGEGMVLIGDRCFDVMNQFKFRYDLAEAWYNYVQLPFVFAVWVANKPIDQDFLNEFNQALALGIEQLPTVIREFEHLHPMVADYLQNKIEYGLSAEKRKAMDMFLNYSL